MLSDNKVENYIDKIKKEGFYADIIELALAAKLFYYTIIVYSVEEEINKNYRYPNKALSNNKINQSNKEKNKTKNFDSDESEKLILYKNLTTIEKSKENYKDINEIIVLL